ncbi:MAG: aminopeptidase [Bernardetiaceae bacterium]|nr:aminopeptidase [Bernardetiaceae bacterium]
MKYIKKLSLFFLFGLIAVAIWQYRLVAYGYMQLKGQLNVIWNAEPIDSVLARPDFPDSLKEKIRLVQEIRDFGVAELGLDPSGSYKKIYDQKGKPILWNLTAAEKFGLAPKTWYFPFLGEVSYKGFFEYEALEREAQRLKAEEQWDIEIYPVSAWSTLGILDDPLLSENLNRSEGRLANLILHELTHGTLYIKNNVTYNENLANFVGDKGALLFLAHKYGTTHPHYLAYTDYKEDRDRYVNFVLQAAIYLDSLYNSFEDMDNRTLAYKKERKAQAMKAITMAIDTVGFSNPAWKNVLPDTLNNAYFSGYLRYDGKRNEFEEEFERDFNSDFPKYFAYLKRKYAK